MTDFLSQLYAAYGAGAAPAPLPAGPWAHASQDPDVDSEWRTPEGDTRGCEVPDPDGEWFLRVHVPGGLRYVTVAATAAVRKVYRFLPTPPSAGEVLASLDVDAACDGGDPGDLPDGLAAHATRIECGYCGRVLWERAP